MSSEAPEIRPKRRKLERPDEILDAALVVFARDGFSGARLEEIADRAGCTKGTIYVYFDSKEELFKAVVHKLIAPEFRRADNILEDASKDVPTRLKVFIKRAYHSIADNPQQFSILRLLIADGAKFPDLVDFYHQQIPRVGHELIKGVIADGIARGELRALDPDLTAHILVGPIVAEITRRLLFARRLPDLDQLIDAHLDIMFNGLLAKPGDKPKKKG